MTIGNAAKEADRLLGRFLRREYCAWPRGRLDEAFAEAFARRALYHGVAGLIAEQANHLTDWPAAVMEPLRTEAWAQAAWELRHREVLAGLLPQLHRRGAQPVFLKGTALAYSCYANPAQRRRGDSDVLVREAALPAAREVLAENGFVLGAETQGRFGDLHLQEIWQLRHADGTEHEIDLHWHVFNARSLDPVLGTEEVFANAVPLPRLGEYALGIDPVRRLLHGCVNRAIHGVDGYYSIDEDVRDADRLIWAFDFDLQAAAFGAAEWAAFAGLAVERGVAGFCADGLRFAQVALGTAVPGSVIGRLEQAPEHTRVHDFVMRSGIGRELAELRAAPGAIGKMRFMLSQLFPSRSFMHAKYPGQAGLPVALLYVRRAAGRFARAARKG